MIHIESRKRGCTLPTLFDAAVKRWSDDGGYMVFACGCKYESTVRGPVKWWCKRHLIQRQNDSLRFGV